MKMPLKYHRKMKAKKGPYLSRKRNYFKRKKRFARSARIVTIPGVSILPDRMMVKLGYNQQDNVTVATGSVVQAQLIRANGPFDPDGFIGGGQPLGWDQWTTFYGRYVVKACKITVNINNTSSACGVVSVVPLRTSTAISASNSLQIQQTPYCRFKFIGSVDGGNSTKAIHHYMTTNKIYGVPSKSIRTEEDFSSLTSTTPLNEWFWHVYINTQVSANFEPALNTRITYYVEFYERTNLPQS